MDQNADIIIIGGGPAGLHMVFQAGLYGMRSLLVEALPMPGGQLAALYPDKEIYDIPGFPHILAQDLIRNLLAQSAVFQPHYQWGRRIDRIDFTGSHWSVKTVDQHWQAPVLVLAAGIGAFSPKKPRCDALETYERTGHVYYDIPPDPTWRNRRVLIQGATAQAISAAIQAARSGAQVTLVNRKEVFEILPDQAEHFTRLREQGAIRTYVPYTVTALGGTSGKLEQAQLKGYGTDDIGLEIDLFLPFLGYGASLGPLKDWELALTKGSISVKAHNMESARAQLYVIGDLADYPGKIKLIISAFAEAALAARHAFNYIYPHKRLSAAYSSSIGPLNLDKTCK